MPKADVWDPCVSSNLKKKEKERKELLGSKSSGRLCLAHEPLARLGLKRERPD
jgi:hypothetical protein